MLKSNVRKTIDSFIIIIKQGAQINTENSRDNTQSN